MNTIGDDPTIHIYEYLDSMSRCAMNMMNKYIYNMLKERKITPYKIYLQQPNEKIIEILKEYDGPYKSIPVKIGKIQLYDFYCLITSEPKKIVTNNYEKRMIRSIKKQLVEAASLCPIIVYNIRHIECILTMNSYPINQELIKNNIQGIKIKIIFPTNYPFNGPLVKIIYPIVKTTSDLYKNGRVCMNMLSWNDWSPRYTIYHILYAAENILGKQSLDETRLNETY